MFEGKRKRGGREGGREVETKRDTENSEVYVLTYHYKTFSIVLLLSSENKTSPIIKDKKNEKFRRLHLGICLT